LASNSTGRVFVDSGGRVGINTSSAPSGAGIRTVIDGLNGGGLELVYNNNGGGCIIPQNGGGLRFFAHTGVVGSESYYESLQIGSAGQIGLGGANYGSSGQVLMSAGSGAAASWQSLSSYLTTSAAASTYAPLASPTFTGTVTIPAGASISGYLTSATAASTYQTQAGMSSYLTSTQIASTYLSQYSITTTSISKTLSNRERCSVTTGGLTITLPASPSAGWEVSITNAGTSTNTVIARNGSNLMSLAENMTIDKADVTVTLYYVDATRGWRII
jgi:hypothetical protein